MSSSSVRSDEAAAIPVEDIDDDLDSAYGDGFAASTASLTDSIREYREINGRTYQNYKDSEYWAPNDDKQSDQLDLVHHMLTMVLDGKLFLAPIGLAPQKVLDVGTGTGIWAIDFADQFPSAEVIGTDISNTMPMFVPPNCRFEIDDCELDWTFAPSSFDFVHIRYMMAAIGDWPRLYAQAFEALKPGGWIEHFELSVKFDCDDGSLTPDNPLSMWAPIQIEASEKMGKSFVVSTFTKERMKQAGYVDVREHKFKLPVGPWSSDRKMKEIGSWNMFFFLRDTEGFCIYLLGKIMGWDHEDVLAWVHEVSTALKNPRVHTYYKATLVYGRKPEEPAPPPESEAAPAPELAPASHDYECEIRDVM